MKLTTHSTNPAQDIELIRDRVNTVWRVEHDPQSGRHDWTETQTTVGAAGSASALPANPEGYIEILVNGEAKVIPYYAAS